MLEPVNSREHPHNKQDEPLDSNRCLQPAKKSLAFNFRAPHVEDNFLRSPNLPRKGKRNTHTQTWEHLETKLKTLP